MVRRLDDRTALVPSKGEKNWRTSHRRPPPPCRRTPAVDGLAIIALKRIPAYRRPPAIVTHGRLPARSPDRRPSPYRHADRTSRPAAFSRRRSPARLPAERGPNPRQCAIAPGPRPPSACWSWCRQKCARAAASGRSRPSPSDRRRGRPPSGAGRRRSPCPPRQPSTVRDTVAPNGGEVGDRLRTVALEQPAPGRRAPRRPRRRPSSARSRHAPPSRPRRWRPRRSSPTSPPGTPPAPSAAAGSAGPTRRARR